MNILGYRECFSTVMSSTNIEVCRFSFSEVVKLFCGHTEHRDEVNLSWCTVIADNHEFESLMVKDLKIDVIIPNKKAVTITPMLSFKDL